MRQLHEINTSYRLLTTQMRISVAAAHLIKAGDGGKISVSQFPFMHLDAAGYTAIAMKRSEII